MIKRKNSYKQEGQNKDQEHFYYIGTGGDKENEK